MKRFILALLFTGIGCLKAQFQNCYNCVQVMHNSADTGVMHLKLWLNDTVWKAQFNYLDATPQTSLASGQVHTIGISAPGATSQAQCIAQTTLDNSNTDYSFAFLAVVGIKTSGPQYNPGSQQKPFGFYTFQKPSLVAEPSPWDIRIFTSHLSTDISSLTVVSGTNIFANNNDYLST